MQDCLPSPQNQSAESIAKGHGVMARRLLGALTAAALVAAGCGGSGEPSPRQTVSEGSTISVATSPASTYPNALPGEKPPVRPADVLSDAGAEAFARYFMQAVDWAYASMDSVLMRGAYDPITCSYCNQAADRTDADKAAGKRYEGGRSHIFKVASAHGADTANNLVLVVFDADAIRVYDGTGNVVSNTGAEVRLQFNVRVRYVDGSWQVDQVKRVVAA
jgi:hypothetical protein